MGKWQFAATNYCTGERPFARTKIWLINQKNYGVQSPEYSQVIVTASKLWLLLAEFVPKSSYSYLED